jgi:hypothetical protein
MLKYYLASLVQMRSYFHSVGIVRSQTLTTEFKVLSLNALAAETFLKTSISVSTNNIN